MEPVSAKLYKAEMREKSRERRLAMPSGVKATADTAVCGQVRKLRQYRDAGAVFVYVARGYEVATAAIIENAFSDGKKVAVPRCVPGTREMRFRFINSLTDLSPGSFSVPEPPEDFPLADGCGDALMLVPGFVFDRYGFRIGHGKGYYDRYLEHFTGATAGLCYESDLVSRIYRDKYDKPVSVVITERKIYKSAENPPKFGG